MNIDIILFKSLLAGIIISFTLSFLFNLKKIKVGKKEKPTFGGLVIYLSILLCLLFSPFSGDFSSWIIFIPFTFMFFLGFWDDHHELSPFVKLIFQSLIAIFTVILGLRTRIIYIPPFLNYLITIVWILVITNAFNFLDIMDGLCVGSVISVAATLVVIGVIKFQPLNLFLSLVILGASLGFFPFNYKNASAYLGDSGSLSLGFIISVLTISFSYAGENNPLALLTPIVILGLPVFDFTYVTLRRILQRKSIFRKSPDHLVLLMRDKGISESRIVMNFWLISLGFSFSALGLQFGSLIGGMLALFLAIILTFRIVFRYCR